jgi:RNA polymerase sigma-70 factor (ECF subfamily)
MDISAALTRDDLALWRAAAAGDPTAAASLLDDHLPIVYGFVLARVAGDQPVAEDIVQETLLEALKSASTYRGDAALSTWLCSIARRRIARHWARERRDDATAAGLTVIGEEQDPVAAVDVREDVSRALAKMSALHRQVLVMKYLDGLSVAEIGDELGRPAVQVQSMLQRARESFRNQLVGDDG